MFMGKGILIVEDDPDIGASLVELLEIEGHQASLASNGLEALEIVKNAKGPFDLILVDYMMPFMDGVRFVQQLEVNMPGFLQRTRVVLLTAASELKWDLPKGVGLLKKPIELDDLLSMVEH
jgi:CheY-like chemotaxis protein